MKTDLTDISTLFFSREFSALSKHGNKFNIFEMMGNQTKELVHSNILAYLLNPEKEHGTGNSFLAKFILRVSALNKIIGVGIDLSETISLLDTKARFHRELEYMDIVIDFYEKKIVFAIENKIHHSEREDQIKDYQAKLPRIYKGYNKYIVIFLTPEGKPPLTADLNDINTAVYTASYVDILIMVDELKETTTGDVRSFYNQFHMHLMEDIVENKEVKKLCFEIYKKYPNAYRSTIDNLPSLSDLKTNYFNQINNKYPNLKIWDYPANNEHKTELSVRSTDWKLPSAEIKVFLDDDYSIKMFAALTASEARRHSDSLNALFGTAPAEVKGGWSWWAFTKNGVSEISNDDVFGTETANKLFNKFDELYREINPALIKFNI